jgi:hypothetical protein
VVQLDQNECGKGHNENANANQNFFEHVLEIVP